MLLPTDPGCRSLPTAGPLLLSDIWVYIEEDAQLKWQVTSSGRSQEVRVPGCSSQFLYACCVAFGPQLIYLPLFPASRYLEAWCSPAGLSLGSPGVPGTSQTSQLGCNEPGVEPVRDTHMSETSE